MRQEQEQEQEEIVKRFFPKIRSYEEGKCRGKSTQLDNLPELREKWDRMYEWILVLMVFIEKMKYDQSKDMRTKRMKFMLYIYSSRIRDTRGNGESSRPAEGIRGEFCKKNPRNSEESQRRKARKQRRRR